MTDIHSCDLQTISMCDFLKFKNIVKIADIEKSRVFKDECLMCFDTPDMNDGLYICLETFYGFDKLHMLDYFKTTGRSIYLNILQVRINEEEEPKEKVQKMAIGVDGGFQVDKKSKYLENYKLIILPDFNTISIPNSNIPQFIMNSINSIIKCESVMKQLDLEIKKFAWDGETRPITKHNNLMQLPNPPKVNLLNASCQKCNITENLWLNLTDGAILCGRKNFDGTGGNNHALEHYDAFKYPLAVKIGTITKYGADVYSYDENNMVEDPNLAKHLLHFGINVENLEKTDKTISELEIEMNENYKEWAAIQETSQKLTPIYGKGYTGIHNLGNTCYISSIVQVIFSLPAFQQYFYDDCTQKMINNLKNPMDNYNFQTCKLSYGLLSGKYSIPPTSDDSTCHNGIKPKLFNLMIKKSYTEFRNNHQQDAHEFFMHFMNQMEVNNYNKAPPSKFFDMCIEERWQCLSTNKCKYTKKVENHISLTLPLDKATNKEEYEKYVAEKGKQKGSGDDKVFARIPFHDVLKQHFAPETIKCCGDLTIGYDTQVVKINRLSTFPKYLLFHVKRYVLEDCVDQWLPSKLDAMITDVPSLLDLGEYVARGPQPDEQLMGDGSELFSQGQQFSPNPQFLLQLKDMGFTDLQCERGLANTGNASVEDASNWILQHLDDELMEDLPITTDKPEIVVNEEHCAAILDMGFPREQANQALRATSNNVERAVDWLFSRQEQLFLADNPSQTVNSGNPLLEANQNSNGVLQGLTGGSNASNLDTGAPVYKLVGCVSHMGNTLTSGHYVAHVLKDGKWAIYNDERVALSENPPLNLAYLYFYERLD